MEIMALLAETECHTRNVLLGGEGDIWILPNRTDLDNHHTKQKPPINEEFAKMMSNLMIEANKELDERILDTDLWNNANAVKQKPPMNEGHVGFANMMSNA
jgi:hypothetical protein